MSFQALMQFYVEGIIRRSQGNLNPFEMNRFSECRNHIKFGISTFEWLLVGLDGHVINTVMQMGDKFLTMGNVGIALEFYREARSLFPHAAICCIREAQCHVVLKSFGQAKKCCKKAIRLCAEEEFNELFTIIDIFIENDRLQDAHDLYTSLLDRFPHRLYIIELLEKVKVLIRSKTGITEMDRPKIEIKKNISEKKKTGGKDPSGRRKTTVKSSSETNNEKLGEAFGGIDLSEQTDVSADTTMLKVVKTSKQRKREQMTGEKEIEKEIEKARRERDEKLKKQKEVEKRKRKEREEREGKMRKEEEVEARRRMERAEHEKKLEIQFNDKIKKQQEKLKENVGKKSSTRSGGDEVLNTKATPSKNSPSTDAVQPKKDKVLLDKMSKDFDEQLSSGSKLRLVCPTCNTPCAFLYNERSCHSCKSELVVWCWNINTGFWTKPRMPPNKNIRGPYIQCKHFFGKGCVKSPCGFAHGDDELETWELLRGKRIDQQALHLRKRRKKKKKKKKKKKASSGPSTTSSSFSDTISSVMEEQKLRCNFCDITFLSMPQLEYHYSDRQHKVNVMKRTQKLNAKSKKFRLPPDGVHMGQYKLCYRFEQGHCYFGTRCTLAHGREECDYWIKLCQLQMVQLSQLKDKRLLNESFVEKVRRRMHVMTDALPGATVNCSSPWRVKLNAPGDHVWIFDVKIQTKYQLPLSEVSFLLETHLDKFEFLSSSIKNGSSNTQRIRLVQEDFVEDSAKQESAVQFCVKFSSRVFGDFEQKLVFDFGCGSILARSLYVSVVSEDVCNVPPRTTYCRILEWSLEEMELVLCKDLIALDSDGLCAQYNVPKVLPDPSKIGKYKRATYCKRWHEILFIEEQRIQMEVARYDIQNATIKIINCFQSTSEMVFAQQGELFGEIYLSDYLVMDEVAGHLINRSVMSVIVRPKMTRYRSKKVYECSITLKTSQSVIIKLNEALLKDYGFQKDQEVYIDVKFRYNRVPMCEMHQAIDMCQTNTDLLLSSLENVSYMYKFKKSIPDWFMGDRKPNTNQHEAIAMILDPNPSPPILVFGPFGTGKTFTLSLACVSILSQSQRNKVLICTHSNSAADIHLEHLNAKKEKKPSLNIQPLRVLNLFRKVHTVPETLRKYCLIEESTNEIKEPVWIDIRDHNVIITTLASARMLWKFYHDGKLQFTHILIDEAAQAWEPECLTPLVLADKQTKIVLAGDHKQMGPRVYSKSLWAKGVGYERSLLERFFFQHGQYCQTPYRVLCQPYVVMLTENYRCHAKILEFPSDCFYGGKLLAKGDQSTHDLIPVLSFYAAQGMDNRDEGSLAYYNDAEVAEVVKRVEELIQLWPKDWSKSIGVLTPYRDQVKRIRDGLRKKGHGYVYVETVENVQGKEFKALFISTVRTMWTCSRIESRNLDVDPSELDFGFLSDPRYVNTAVTRAQSLLAVVGDPMSLCSVGACRNLWKDYLQRCDDNKGLYGCTLKTVMDFCLRSHQLDPSAHEFIPVTNKQDKKDETSTNTSFRATGEGENDAETNQTATDNFFRRHDVDDFDTLKELVKATKKRGESRLQKARNKHLPPLNDFPQAAVTPHWPNISSKRIFSAGLKDNTIKRGFHVKESEVLFWLTGGKSSLREKGDKESCLDIGKKKKKASSGPSTTSSPFFGTISSVMKEQKLRCNFCDITFLSMPQLEYHYSDRQHKVNVMKRTQKLNAKSTKFRLPPDGVHMGRYKLCYRFEQGHCYFGTRCTLAHGREECDYWIKLYQLQRVQLTKLENNRLLNESFVEKVRRRIQNEGPHVITDALPCVTVNCSSPWRVKLNRPRDHVWIFDVKIQTKYQLPLSEVSFLLETHLDKFEFLSSSIKNGSSNTQRIRLVQEDFVEDSAKQESAVQFCVKFSSRVFGDFEQKLIFDFGCGSILARSLCVSVVSEDICNVPPPTTYCRILEWSLEEMELVLCKDLIALDSDGICAQYNVPNVLPDPSKIGEFKRETYCKLWHEILFIEEQHIQMEVARYDIQNGTMKIVNCFQSTSEMVFAQQGELFGEIYLSDYLVMDEVAGHLINRSVMSVIVRPKMTRSRSKKVYECSIKLKASQSVIIKLNEAILNDYRFKKDQEIYIDVKFRYNRVPMCEMHEAIDMCKQKTEVLLPNLKNVSYTFEKSIPDWFMGDRKPNPNQHKAIAMILDPNPTPPILVIGPFGTGKTFTLSLACVSILSQSQRNKVLVCTHSNSTADIHLEHLNARKEKSKSLNIQPLRVLNLFRKVHTVPEKLRKHCLIEESTNVINEPIWIDIRDHNVIITTLATARMLWKFYQDGKLHFTHILIDEAAQALEPECLTPLVMADKKTKIVLAGDHMQVGPRIYSQSLWAEGAGRERSLLERLFYQYKQYNNQTPDQPSSSPDDNSTFCQTPYVVLLTENYRSHAKIIEFPSDCFYGGELIAKGDQSTHDLVPVLSFYAAQGMDNQDEGSLAYYNDAEVAEVVKRVEELIQLWPKDWSKSIGVLTPYRDQVKRIRDGLRKKGLGYVAVETVENVQGKEFKALFISTVRTMWTCSQIESRNLDDPSELDFGFLSDPRFLNTAVTRAQSLLAVVGDPMSLCSVGACRNLWKDYLQRCDANKGLYGCTLKTVMDFCLRSQQLDPGESYQDPAQNRIFDCKVSDTDLYLIVKARSLALRFTDINPCCVRAIPCKNATKADQQKSFVMCLYVDSGNKGVPDDLKQAANKMFVDYEIEYVDLQQRPLHEIVTRLPASKRVKDKELRDLSKIIEKNLHVFEDRLNVTAVQASYKVVNSSERDIICVTVFVLGKGRIPVGETDLKKLDNNPFDVDIDVVEGYYQPCSNNYKSYAYPLYGGVGIGIDKDDERRVGTLGGFLKDESGTRYILSCEHVLNPDENEDCENEVVQPAETDFERALEDASSSVNAWSERLKNQVEKMETLTDQAYSKYEKRVRETKETLEELKKNQLKVANSKPRSIGKYICGLKQNEEIKISENNCVNIYVDAAIAELNEEEAEEIEMEKDDEPRNDFCPLYGFKNDKENGFSPTGKIVDLREFDLHHDSRLIKIGRTTGLTVDGEFETTKFFLNFNGYQRNTCAGNLSRIPYIFYCNSCEPLTKDNQVDLTCIRRPCCAKCKKQIENNITVRWAYNCMAIRKPKKPFCEEGDSGALVFDRQGRVWGMVFGVFSAEGINFDFGLATPFGVTLQALGKISGKNLTLWEKEKPAQV